MSSRRAPSAPPLIPGFTFVRVLGSGGFADVFLYDQQMPRRRVAVKVLLSDAMTDAARAGFYDEANLMAQLSTHPSIVTIYQAGISSDGRPYLAMEYCSRPNLGARFRAERVGIAEALRIGVQIAGAVETSHRAGILHRDIKPANILVTEYNRPALTDFGISSSLVEASQSESIGMSIPWSPPESFQNPPLSSPASDVYALGATIYSLLAGRAPFEVPGAPNSGLDLIERAEHGVLPPTGRADVPLELERVLATAMARNAAARYDSALAFARALQQVQVQLAMDVTTVDVLEEPDATVTDAGDDDAGSTRLRALVTIEQGDTSKRRRPERLDERRSAPAPSADTLAFAPPLVAGPPVAATPAVPSAAPTPPAAFDEETVLRSELPPRPGVVTGAPPATPAPPGPASPSADDATVSRTAVAEAARASADEAVADAARAKRRPRALLLASLAVIVLVVGAGIAFAVSTAGGSIARETHDPGESAPVDVQQGASVPLPSGLIGQATAEGVVFTWSNPQEQPGDVYLWNTVEAGQTPSVSSTDELTVTVPASASGRTCIEVLIRRTDGTASPDPATACVP